MIDTVVRETWSRILERLRDEIGERPYGMWFERSSVLSLRRGVLGVGVPNLFIRDWVHEHYGPVMERIAEEVMGAPLKIAIRVDPDLFREMRLETERMEEVVTTGPDSVDGKTLESFVSHPGNLLAVRALRHAAARRAPPMNPLVVHGPEGTGKSHLAAALDRIYPSGTTFYRMTGEDFARRFAWNLKTRRIDQLREQIGGADVVILDDAQDLAGKPATQREVSTLIQELLARGGQIVAFLDRHPREVAELDEGFCSILLSGMLIGMEPPGKEDTIRILELILRSARRRIPTDLITLVVERVGGSVTRLDRLVRKVYAFAGLTGEPVNAEFLDRHLDEIAGPADPDQRRLETILGLVEDHFDVERADLMSKRKTKSLSMPRGVVVFLLREQGGLTFKSIGKALGDRSHTSVYLMHKKYAESIRGDVALMDLVREAGRRLVTAGA